MLKKPQNVYLPIDKFQAKVFKNADLSKRGEWVSNFALSLAGESNDDFAEELLTEAQVSFYKEKVRKWKNYIKNIICNENEGVVPTENEIYTRCCEEYGDEFVEAVELVESNLKKNKKPKKNTAGAPNGNNGDVSATACGNNSKGSPRPSTDGDNRKDSHEHTCAGNGVKSESRTSVEKSYAQALDSLTDKASDQAASNTGITTPVVSRESGQFKKNALGYDKRPAGGSTPSSSSLVPPAGTVDVLSLAYSGEFGNVKLTQEQYAELGIRFGNQQKLNRAIDSLSCKIENEEIKPRNHYAVLVKWAAYRDDMEDQNRQEDSAPKMTEMEKSWIRESEKIARYEKEIANERR